MKTIVRLTNSVTERPLKNDIPLKMSHTDEIIKSVRYITVKTVHSFRKLTQ